MARRTSATSVRVTTDLPRCCSSSSGWCTPTTGSCCRTPCRPARSLNIRGLAVTNNFGERFWIEAAGRGSDESWQRWNVFSLSIKGEADEPADLTLLDAAHRAEGAGGRAAGRRSRWRATRWRTWSGASKRSIPLPSGGTRAGNVAAGELSRPSAGAARCRRRRAGGSHRMEGRRPLRHHDHRARALDSIRSRARRERQPPDPATARGHAALPRERSRAHVRARPAAHHTAARGTRPGPAVPGARGGGAARRHARDADPSSARAGRTAASSRGSACASRPAAARDTAGSRSIASCPPTSPGSAERNLSAGVDAQAVVFSSQISRQPAFRQRPQQRRRIAGELHELRVAAGMNPEQRALQPELKRMMG